MKSRIFIAIHYMHLGGAEMALLGLLQSLNPEKVDVDLFVYSHEGELMTQIPPYINLLHEIPEYQLLEQPLKTVIRKGYWTIALARIIAKLAGGYKYRRSGSKLLNSITEIQTAHCVSSFLPNINESIQYDLAISFLTPHNYVLNKVHSKKKVAWIHTDYTRIAVDVKCELKVWGGYDIIVSISDDVTSTFLSVFPSLAPKIVKIENILLSEYVQRRADEFVVEWSSENCECVHKCLKLLSVGRFCEQKNYDNVPDICSRIIQSGGDIRWYIIGFGIDESLIRQKIVETGMQEHVIILGKKTNPYPYIKACDIYVQPSRYEGKSVTVREAQMLYKPVVVTNYATAGSQIRDGVDGVIVPMDNEGCARGIVEFIHDAEQQQRIIAYLKSHDYGNEEEVDKIYDMLKL